VRVMVVLDDETSRVGAMIRRANIVSGGWCVGDL